MARAKKKWSGGRLKKARAALKMTQAELADKVGVDRMTLYRWEADDFAPRAEHILDLCRITGKAYTYFYV